MFFASLQQPYCPSHLQFFIVIWLETTQNLNPSNHSFEIPLKLARGKHAPTATFESGFYVVRFLPACIAHIPIPLCCTSFSKGAILADGAAINLSTLLASHVLVFFLPVVRQMIGGSYGNHMCMLTVCRKLPYLFPPPPSSPGG